jgi:hypothetical protein
VRILVFCLLVPLVACHSAHSDIFDEIAPAAVVCIGKDALDEERQAADLIVGALRARSGPARVLTDEELMTTPASESGRWHIIVVGGPLTNSVLLTYPTYWALDREVHYAPLGNMPAAPFTETRGFYVGGFGYFFAGHNVGFVEFDRSPFYGELLLSLPPEQKATPDAAPPLRFVVRVTGSSPNGVLLGARRFVETRMLYGLALGPPRWPRARDLWNLDDEYTKPDPPAWIPKGTYSFSGLKDSKPTVSFLGWLMADRTMYAGFLEVAGCRPVQMWRAKYKTEAGLLDFNRSPHHRASGNELLIVRLSSANEIDRALKKLGATATLTVCGHTCYRTNGLRGDADEAVDTVEKTSSSTSAQSAQIRRTEEQPGPPLTEGSSPTWILPATVGGEHYLILTNFESGCAEVVLGEMVRSISGK